MKKRIGFIILSCFLFVLGSCDTENSVESYSDDYVASDSTELSIGTYYSTDNLLSVKSSDDTFGDSTFEDATFFNSSFEETANYSTEDDYLSNYSNINNDYISVAFSYSSLLNAPISYSDFWAIGASDNLTITITGNYNGYGYQDLALNDLYSATTSDTRKTYFNVDSSVDDNVTSSVASIIGSDITIDEKYSFTKSFTYTNETDEREYFRVEDRFVFKIYEVAVYKKLSNSVYELEDTFYQYAYSTYIESTNNASFYYLDDGHFRLTSDYKTSDYYYFD